MKGGRRFLIAPSILSADFLHLGDEIRAVEAAGADWIHLDVMDGRFVPNISMGIPLAKACHEATKLPLDVHLMIVEPERYVEEFARAGAAFMTVHVEACMHLHRVIQQMRELGVHPGVALNPSTPLASVEEVLTDVELILLMTVNPGFGGQEYIPETTAKIRRLRAMGDRAKAKFILEVDGGIRAGNIEVPADAGADAFVSGSGVFGRKPEYRAAILDMRRRLERLTRVQTRLR